MSVIGNCKKNSVYRILENSKSKGYSFEDFESEFIKICNNHRREGKAIAFAFILYDFDNENIIKVLNDDDYWNSLNHISGDYLSVFSFHYKKKTRQKVERDISKQPTQYLTRVAISVSPSESSKNLITRYFGNTKVNFPAILFFQVNDEKVIDMYLAQLNETRIEESFLEIKKIINSAVNALKDIKKENYSNIETIFKNMEDNIKEIEFGVKYKKAKNALIEVSGFIKILKMFI